MKNVKAIEKQLVLRSLGPQVGSFEVFYGRIEDGQFVPDFGFMKPDTDFREHFDLEKINDTDVSPDEVLFTSDAIGLGVYVKRSDFYRFITFATSLVALDDILWLGDTIVFKYTFHVPEENEKDENA